MPKRVLIADDIGVLRQGLEVRLKQIVSDVEVTGVSRAEDVVDRILSQGERYDLLLVDISTESAMSGAEAIRRLRGHGITTPAYLISTDKMGSYASQVGATGVLLRAVITQNNGVLLEQEIGQYLQQELRPTL